MLALFVWVLAACAPAEAPSLLLEGPTMGTRYQVRVVPEGHPDRARLAAGVQAVLDALQASMTTYDPESELMRLNRAPLGEWLPVSADLFRVLEIAREVHDWTEGAFDPGVGELVNLWGFGPDAVDALPEDAAVQAARARLGFAALELDAVSQRVRKGAPLALDLSAVAKGYAVDRVADYLESQGIVRYLIEVGGEIRARGHNPRQRPWRVAIERPQLATGSVQTVLPMTEGSLATSGDYRNFRLVDDTAFSHTIDPATGHPARNRLASVSVVLPGCAHADAVATGLMAMGEVRARALAEARGWPVYLILHDGDRFDSWASTAFHSLQILAGE